LTILDIFKNFAPREYRDDSTAIDILKSVKLSKKIRGQQTVDDFLTKYWDYYHQLLDYKKTPNPEKSIHLAKAFDELFHTQTDYEQLNDRIAKTLAKREELLISLKYPKLPLHNNASELALVCRQGIEISVYIQCMKTELK